MTTNKTNERLCFRAWDKINKKMIYDIGVNHCVEEVCSDGLWTDDWNNYEIMQSTGLRDRNNKLIFEGDIIKYHSTNFIGVVKYRTNPSAEYYLWSNKLCQNLNMVCDIEKIGNKFEDSHLLDKS